VIERAVIVSDGNTMNFDWWHGRDETMEQSTASQSLEQIEKEHILAIMERCHWKINGENGAAEVLAMHPNTLRSKMKRLGITRPMTKDTESVTPA
jgi:formate hydrogenlyase transcriptional activator